MTAGNAMPFRSRVDVVSPVVHVIFSAEKPYLFGAGWKTLLEPNDWLYSLRCEGSTQSPRTWRTYAYALGDHLAWCVREDLDWQTLTRADMERYVASLTGSDETVNHRITVLVRFYRWAEARQLTLRTPFVFRETWVRRPGFFGEATRLVMRPNMLRRIPRSEKICVPCVSDVWRLRTAMPCWRDQLLVDVLMLTGLRCSELLDLRLAPFLEARVEADERAVFVEVLGKGRKQRHVPFPAGLMRNLKRYIVLERKYVAGAESHDQVFVSARGAPLKPSGVEFVLRRVSMRLGLAIHPHLLRHFFACHRLKYLTDLGIGDPLGQLQRELGHTLITTTTRYLHLTDELRARIASDHQNFIAAIAGGLKRPGDIWSSAPEPATVGAASHDR